VNTPTRIIDVGDSVQCDLCNTEYRGSDAQGGILVQSKGVCPKCAPKFEADLIKYDEAHLIRDRCPEGMTFHAWVMQLRGGDNSIKVYSL
jgi:hypothetical protein